MKKQSRLDRVFLSKPGDTILDTIETLKMTQAELAERMGKTPSKINDLITGKEPITINTALQLETVLGLPASFMLKREANYRERLARIEEEEKLSCWIPWAQFHPVKELKKCGFISTADTGHATVKELLKFYGIATPQQWESIYLQQYTSARFRKSEAFETKGASITSWLRMGEIEMNKLQLPEYNKDVFKQVVSDVRDLVMKHPENFAKQLQQKCMNAGVALVYTQCLPKAPVSGAARWVGGNPLIQLSDRYKTNDHFWFTFYHEAGHILLHGKKEVFLEEVEDHTLDEEKETEADRFASKWLLPDEFENDIKHPVSEKNIMDVARKYRTHPGIVVGRLQKIKAVPYSFGYGLKEKLSLFN